MENTILVSVADPDPHVISKCNTILVSVADPDPYVISECVEIVAAYFYYCTVRYSIRARV